MKRVFALVGIVGLLIATLALPALADPPEQVDDPLFLIFPDVENGLVVFWNVTRAGFCAWEAGGFIGPSPALEDVTISFHETGQGVLNGSYHETRPLELWNMDEGADLSGACQDTDGQSGPFATGDATVTASDNDVDVSGTRTNAFGERGQGKVFDSDGGAWHYSWVFTAQCRVDCTVDFVLRAANNNLNKMGQ